MEREELQGLLEQLHRELEQGGPADDETQSLLRTVLDDISTALDRSDTPAPAPGGAPEPEPASLAGRLREATWRLEESHPRLTNAAERLIEALGPIFE